MTVESSPRLSRGLYALQEFIPDSLGSFQRRLHLRILVSCQSERPAFCSPTCEGPWSARGDPPEEMPHDAGLLPVLSKLPTVAEKQETV